MNVTVTDVPFVTATKEIGWKTFLEKFLIYIEDAQDRESVKNAQKEDNGEEVSLDEYKKIHHV